MLNSFLKWLLFPLAGLVMALIYLPNGGNHFRPEEVVFQSVDTENPGMEGVMTIPWKGKRLWVIRDSAKFSFSLSQPRTQVLQLRYKSNSSQNADGIRVFINNTPCADLLLQSRPDSFDQVSLTLPFHLLRTGKNTLVLSRSQEYATPLNLESLKIRNYEGYSTGVLTAYILPAPPNPSLKPVIQWRVHKLILIPFMAAYGLWGFLYGVLLSYRFQWPLALSFRKGSWVLLPSSLLFSALAIIPMILPGALVLNLKSYIFLNVLLSAFAMLGQLRLGKPSSRILKDFFGVMHQRKVWLILIILAMIFLSILYLYSLKFNKNITGFMVIGDYFEAPQVWNSKTLVHQGSVGYDGQFYYYIAHDPFITAHIYNHIDFPAYRYQRIMYPLCTWMLSLGLPKVIPYMMVLVNLLAILLGTYFVTVILRHFQRSPWWSLCYASFWGFLLCLLRCLPEPLAIAFLAMAVAAFLKEKWLLMGLSLSLAALTQETTLLVSLAFLFTFFQKRDFRKFPCLALPFLAYGLWQIYIFIHFKTFSFLGGTQNFSLPFWGLLQKILLLIQTGLTLESGAELIYLALVLVLVPIAFYQALKKKEPLTLSFAGYALMTAVLNQLIWVEPWSYARATLGLLFFNLLVFTKEGRWLNLWPMLLGPFVFLLSLISMKLF